jgi:hypothetical protein
VITKRKSQDIARLENEVRRSMADDNIDPHSFYWFLATEEGKKEDLLLRGKVIVQGVEVF